MRTVLLHIRAARHVVAVIGAGGHNDRNRRAGPMLSRLVQKDGSTVHPARRCSCSNKEGRYPFRDLTNALEFSPPRHLPLVCKCVGGSDSGIDPWYNSNGG